MEIPENNKSLSEMEPNKPADNKLIYYSLGVIFSIPIFLFLGGGLSTITKPYIGLPIGIFIFWLYGLLLGWILHIQVIPSGKSGENTLMSILCVCIIISVISGWLIVGMEKQAVVVGMFGGFCLGGISAIIFGGLFNGDPKSLFHDFVDVKFTRYYIGSGIGALIGGLLGGFIGSLMLKIINSPAGCILVIIVVIIISVWFFLNRKKSVLPKQEE